MRKRFRVEGHAALNLIDPITMDPIISYPDSDRLKYENCRYNETTRRSLHTHGNFLWKSAPRQAVSEVRLHYQLV